MILWPIAACCNTAYALRWGATGGTATWAAARRAGTAGGWTAPAARGGGGGGARRGRGGGEGGGGKEKKGGVQPGRRFSSGHSRWTYWKASARFTRRCARAVMAGSTSGTRGGWASRGAGRRPR